MTNLRAVIVFAALAGSLHAQDSTARKEAPPKPKPPVKKDKGKDEKK